MIHFTYVIVVIQIDFSIFICNKLFFYVSAIDVD